MFSGSRAHLASWVVDHRSSQILRSSTALLVGVKEAVAAEFPYHSEKFARGAYAKLHKKVWEWISLPAQTHSPSVSSPFLTVKFFPDSTTQLHVRSKWCWGSASNCKGNWAYPLQEHPEHILLTQLSNFDEKTAKLLRTPHVHGLSQPRWHRSPWSRLKSLVT